MKYEHQEKNIKKSRLYMKYMKILPQPVISFSAKHIFVRRMKMTILKSPHIKMLCSTEQTNEENFLPDFKNNISYRISLNNGES